MLLVTLPKRHQQSCHEQRKREQPDDADRHLRRMHPLIGRDEPEDLLTTGVWTRWWAREDMGDSESDEDESGYGGEACETDGFPPCCSIRK